MANKEKYDGTTPPIKCKGITTIPYRSDYVQNIPDWGTPEYKEWWDNAYPAERYGRLPPSTETASNFNIWSNYYYQELTRVEALREKKIKAFDILKDMLEIETDSFDGSDMEFHTIRRLRFKQDCRDISEDEYNILKEIL